MTNGATVIALGKVGDVVFFAAATPRLCLTTEKENGTESGVPVSDPMMTSVDLIRYAIADQVRELGGDTDKIDQIAMSAAYAIFHRHGRRRLAPIPLI